ncbi:fatty acid desaturase [Purpureocillium lilacinum]|uniref:Fatty acid desaturase n=1 Tax=Purpureocillium lilacinum TaxID=33203 RepID=A0A2U3ECM9_PURLI|nr:hypothetical protein Purlil1_1580 [Purpureocillium lilacinum]PWI72268.1 fatty acid desaturase [Purpureocillium lilacinum]
MDKTRAASQFDVHRSHRPIHKCQNKNQLQHQQRHQRPDLAGGPQQTTAAHTRGLARFPFLENGSPASSDRACQLSRVRLVPSRPAAVLRATVARSSPGKRSTAFEPAATPSTCYSLADKSLDRSLSLHTHTPVAAGIDLVVFVASVVSMAASAAPGAARMDRDQVLTADVIDAMIANGDTVVIFQDYVLRLNSWLALHPGGSLAILHMVGRDATNEITA